MGMKSDKICLRQKKIYQLSDKNLSADKWIAVS